MDGPLGSALIHHLPIATTLVAAAFAPTVLARWRRRRPAPHLFWWGVGITAYGVGTLTEAITTLFGWHEVVFRAWYVSGALLGAAPLAQGTAYLLLRRWVAHAIAMAVGLAVIVGAVFVLRAPIDLSVVEPHRLGVAPLGSSGARAFSPFINGFAVTLLVGGAVASALRYRHDPEARHRFLGNVWIAVGAALPGVGGAAARVGATQVLYVTELVGLVLIWIGYRYNVAPGPASPGGPAAPGANATTTH